MDLLIDSGFLYAVVDRKDKNHDRVVKALTNLSSEIIVLPTVVLVEVTYLIRERVGLDAMHKFVLSLKDSALRFECIGKTDIPRIYELLEQYHDARLDFVDAVITTLTERLNIQRILTVDQRDFRTIRPKHCQYFEILP